MSASGAVPRERSVRAAPDGGERPVRGQKNPGAAGHQTDAARASRTGRSGELARGTSALSANSRS